MPASEKKLKRVLKTEMRDGVFMGLVEYEDGTQEWKAPTSASVEITNERTGEKITPTDVKIAGVSCA